MKDENFILPHEGRGILSMANAGPNTNGSQFFILFNSAPHLDGKHTVFGKLVAGFNILDAIEKAPTSAMNNKPTKDIKIVRCGQLSIERSAENASIPVEIPDKPVAQVEVDSDASSPKKKSKKDKKEKRHKFDDGPHIQVVTAPYFLATKLEAFNSRGNRDFLGSHDFEDLVSVIDGRPELLDEVERANPPLTQYLAKSFREIYDNRSFYDALPGHFMPYGSLANERIELFTQKIFEIVQFIEA